MFDLDCFYAQCEQVRLGLQDEPECSLALLQWNSTLAVTYPARRKYGIKRGDSWDAIHEKSGGKCYAIHLHILQSQGDCRDLTVSPTASSDKQSIATREPIHDNKNGPEAQQLEEEESLEASYNKIYKMNLEQQLEARKQLGVRRNYTEGKACLERYRIASMRIFAVVLESLTKHLGSKDQFVLERASIDEFYLDITNYCFENKFDTQKNDGLQEDHNTVVVGDSSIHEADQSSVKQALHRACQVSHWIRSDARSLLGFTMSAGISTNKMMAKLAASYGKPNGQAVLHPENFSTLMKSTKVKKVRNFGGKLGKQVLSKFLQNNEDATMGDLAKISLPLLQHHLSKETGQFVFDACRGKDTEPVKETTGALVKSITAFKSFTATSSRTEIEKWLDIISSEIVTRVATDAARNKRYPKTCTLNFTYYTTKDGKRPKDGTHRSQRNTKSVRLDFPNERLPSSKRALALKEKARQRLLPILAKHPLRGVGMSANSFETRGQPPPGVASINTFFVSATKSETLSHNQEVSSSDNCSTKKVRSQATGVLGKSKDRGIKALFAASASKSTAVSSAVTDAKENKTNPFETDCDNVLPDSSTTDKDLEMAMQLQAQYEANAEEKDNQIPPSSRRESVENDAIDNDLALARKLQATYDRENYVFSATKRAATSKERLANKKTRRIDSFFQKR